MDQDGKDPFTSSREGIVEDDENFQSLMDYLKLNALPKIMDKWDELRLERNKDGDEENKRKSKKERLARRLYSIARKEYELDDDAPAKDEVDLWLNDLRDDAEFNWLAYSDCFLSENLVRKYIKEHKIELSEETKSQIKSWKVREATNKSNANISFDIRRENDDLIYLGMDRLALTAEGSKDDSSQSLKKDAVAYKPVRNIVGHTGSLTENAKSYLTLNLENIKARVKNLVSKKT